MYGDVANNIAYNTEDIKSEKNKTVEKSMLSAPFFWISAVLKPPSTMTFAIFVKITTNATTPYSSGIRSLARIMEIINETPCTLHFSINFHAKDFTIVLFEIVFIYAFFAKRIMPP